MAEASTPLPQAKAGFAQTERTDRWWIGPALTFGGLMFFIIYATWAAFQGAHYYVGPYLSPFYSPVVFSDVTAAGAAPLEHSLFGAFPAWWPSFLPASPALIILAFPGAFRFTCYYYRKAYYRSFSATPAGCSVGALPQKNYKGETFLLLFQNLHRYALYFALIFVFILYYDAFLALSYHGEFGIGVGTIVLFINATLLAGYTFGCHSFRHLIGGKLDCFTCNTACSVRHGVWKKSTWLNIRHMNFAWFSLFWVGFSDFYVRMVSMGMIKDLNTWSSF